MKVLARPGFILKIVLKSISVSSRDWHNTLRMVEWYLSMVDLIQWISPIPCSIIVLLLLKEGQYGLFLLIHISEWYVPTDALLLLIILLFLRLLMWIKWNFYLYHIVLILLLEIFLFTCTMEIRELIILTFQWTMLKGVREYVSILHHLSQAQIALFLTIWPLKAFAYTFILDQE